MKKLENLKTVQLIVYICLTLLCFILIVFNRHVYGDVSSDPSMRIVTIMLWIVMAVSFFFIFLDFTFYSIQKKNIESLSKAVKNDPMANIANRLSCDEIIETYLDKPLPEDFGCIMFDLSNIVSINRNYGRLKGNQAIKKFSVILKMASVGHCFVGRNGGNQFLALFEECSDEKMQSFLDRVARKVSENNADPDAVPLEYTYGQAFHENLKDEDITSLISLASRRARAKETAEPEVRSDSRNTDETAASESSGTPAAGEAADSSSSADEDDSEFQAVYTYSKKHKKN